MKRRVVGALTAAVTLLSVAATPSAASGFAVMRHDNVTVVYDTARGTADVYWGFARRVTGFSSQVKLPTGTLSTKDYRGGCRYDHETVTCRRYGLPTLRQKFTFDGPDDFLVQLEVSSDKP
ncbi:hypothetical protein GCM10029964_025360 [Kibdelosporangium lantanae]